MTIAEFKKTVLKIGSPSYNLDKMVNGYKTLTTEIEVMDSFVDVRWVRTPSRKDKGIVDTSHNSMRLDFDVKIPAQAHVDNKVPKRKTTSSALSRCQDQ